MRYRTLPRTTLSLSEIGFPVSEITKGEPALDPAGATRLLEYAHYVGVTFFDTSDVADGGLGEELLFAALGRTRHQITIAARGGYDWYTPAFLRKPASFAEKLSGGIPQDFSPDYIQKACEASLKRLRTDYIDLYFLHDPGMRALEREALFYTLDTLRREGKIRHFGIILGPGTDWDEEGEMALKERKAVSVEAVYNIFHQKPARQLFPLAAQSESGIIAADPLAGGLLTKGYADDDLRFRELTFLKRHGIPLAQAALKFALADPAIVSTLPPVIREDRLLEYASASDLPPLSANDVGQLRDLYDAGFGVQRGEGGERRERGESASSTSPR